MNLRHLPAVLAALLLAASCTSGTEGIFASIEREQAIQSNDGLPANVTVTHMAELNGRYYAAGGGQLFQRTLGTTKWSGSQLATTASGVRTVYKRVMAIGRVGAVGSAATPGTGRLYAVANQGASDSNRLLSSEDGSLWTEALAGVAMADTLAPVRQTDGQSSDELVATAADNQKVYRLNGSWTSSTAPVDLGTAASGPVVAAAVSGTDYYVANENHVYYLPNFTAPAAVTGLPAEASGWYSGLIILSNGGGNTLDGAYLTTGKNGELLKGTLGGSVWTPVQTIANPAKSASGIALTLGGLLYQNSSGVNSLWVATGAASLQLGYGYGSVDTSLKFSDPPADTDSSNFSSTKIASSSVPLLFKGTEGSYFLGTVTQGLWNWNPTTKKWSQQ